MPHTSRPRRAPDDIVDLVEGAAVIHYHPDTIRRKLIDGAADAPPFRKVGGRWKASRAELIDWFDRQWVEAAS